MKVNKFVSFCYNKSALQSITNKHLSNLFWPENQYPPIPIGLAFVYECNIVDAGCKYSRLALPNIWIWQKKNLFGFASKYCLIQELPFFIQISNSYSKVQRRMQNTSFSNIQNLSNSQWKKVYFIYTQPA